MQDLRTELSELVDEAEWNWLIPHLQRDAIVIVDRGLDLVEAGIAVTNDQVPIVQRWISEGLIYKPSPEILTVWERDCSQRFNTLIVQPYVLVQILERQQFD